VLCEWQGSTFKTIFVLAPADPPDRPLVAQCRMASETMSGLTRERLVANCHNKTQLMATCMCERPPPSNPKGFEPTLPRTRPHSGTKKQGTLSLHAKHGYQYAMNCRNSRCGRAVPRRPHWLFPALYDFFNYKTVPETSKSLEKR